MFQNKKEVVGEYKILKRKKGSEEALKILKKLVSQVKPILTKRNWSVRYLCEFFPKNPNLLGTNVNQGYKINLRLRPHYDDTVFLEYNDILGTLLHEGPHDEIFYKLLSELREETEMLMASGYSGEGFHSNGQRLGSNSSVPLYKSNQVAGIAAEKRKQLDKIMIPQGGIRLGGQDKVLLSPVQMASIAAERRLRDQVWCGGSITIEDDDDEESNQHEDATTPIPTIMTKRKPLDQPESSSKRVKQQPQLFIDLTDNNDVNENQDQLRREGWNCSTCTFFNGSIVLVCTMCLTERPIEKEEQEQRLIGDDSWLCPQCTLKNEMQWSVCNACQYVYLR